MADKRTSIPTCLAVLLFSILTDFPLLLGLGIIRMDLGRRRIIREQNRNRRAAYFTAKINNAAKNRPYLGRQYLKGSMFLLKYCKMGNYRMNTYLRRKHCSVQLLIVLLWIFHAGITKRCSLCEIDPKDFGS